MALSNPSSTVPAWRWVTRCLLVILILGGIARMWLGWPLRACKEAVTSAGSVVEVCGPVPLTDARVVLYVLVVVLLLLPELTELEVPGVVRIRRDVEDARRELDRVQQLAAQVHADLQAHASAVNQSQQTVHVTVNEPRSLETADALAAARAGQAPSEDEGAYAMVAFTAGMAGLTTLLSGELAWAAIAGFTADDDGSLSLAHATTDLPGVLLADLTAAVNRLPTQVTTGDRGGDGWWVAAPATDADGTQVGTLAVVGGLTPQVPGAAIEPSDTVIADVQLAAKAYARLLIDLLGEAGRIDAEHPSREDGAWSSERDGE